MKTLPHFQSLVQQIIHWRRHDKPLKSSLAASSLPATKVQSSLNSSRSGYLGPDSSPAIFAIAVISLTGVLGHQFYNQPKLGIGTIAPQTIKAPATASIEDHQSTEANRKSALTGAVPVLMLDSQINQQIQQDLQQALNLSNQLRQSAGDFPFTDTAILSTSAQAFLRECSDSEWQVVLNTTLSNPTNIHLAPADNSLSASVKAVVAQLQAYRQQHSTQQFSLLLNNISQARERYTQTLIKLSNSALAKTAISYQTALLELPDSSWHKTAIGITDSASRMLAQGIAPGLSPSILDQAVSLQVKNTVPKTATVPATELLLSVLRPNLKEDAAQTKLQAEQAAAAVPPVVYHLRKGQEIVHKGEVITPEKFLELDYFGLSHREINSLGLIQLGGIVIAVVGVFGLVEQRFYPNFRQKDRLVVLLMSLSTPLLVTVGIPFTNLPAVGLLLGSFYGSPLGLTVVGLLTGLLRGGLHLRWGYLLPGAAGGVLGSLIAGRLRSREELAWLGIGVGLTQAIVYLILEIVLGTTAGSFWYVSLLQAAAVWGFSGLAWSIVALGLSPYLEQIFDLVTPSRLAELANPNRPLLKQLAAKTPGTFQHTMFVATLAEAAARALDCNVELVRAGTLYHDIGKMHDPQSFIENQIEGGNKHDEINDPWKSAAIIKKHVTEGLVMARKHRLPTAVQAFIPEHQGTMLIAYFYHQAQQLAKQDPNLAVQDQDFRYDGPIPQSRESGIVMLADACEAALRSLKDACPEQALATVNKILCARWQDNQLVDSGLTRDEMSQIAEIFVAVWQQFNHKRIAYPKTLK